MDDQVSLLCRLNSTYEEYFKHYAQLLGLNLPSIKEDYKRCRQFLLTGKTLDSKKAPIAWSNFYNPRVDGVGI